MKKNILLVLCYFTLTTWGIHSQTISLEKENLRAVNTFLSFDELDGEKVIRVTKDPAIEEFDEATFIRINNIDFSNGTIEVKVLSRLLPDAPDFSRGFIGIAFHINSDNSQFESIYIRPTNSRSDDQIRRNHTVQYFAYPDYKFQRLRIESPEKYESYANIELGEWIQVKVQVDGEKARLFLNGIEEASLIVNDLKLGGNKQGAIGLFVDIGTEGFFKDLKVY